MTAPAYSECASADYAWDAVIERPRGSTVDHVRTVLIGQCDPDLPITAAIQELDGQVVRVALLRDPSRIWGTPAIAEYVALAERLTTKHGWLSRPGIRVSPSVIVPLGLREGYEPGAPLHTVDDVRRHLDDHGASGCGLAAAHLFSARHVDGWTRLYDEPGVVITAHPDALPAITAAAGALRQDRFVVTDYENQRTYAMRAEEAS
ncbi:hypothetical protein [Amycolatopsis sp. cmx-4-83]|uniref:hypothetical protein n=1 Tax=Amycolatopsis sp. cmx-4-83 TaxID=2790940 RepID=UPI00397B4362